MFSHTHTLVGLMVLLENCPFHFGTIKTTRQVRTKQPTFDEWFLNFYSLSEPFHFKGPTGATLKRAPY